MAVLALSASEATAYFLVCVVGIVLAALLHPAGWFPPRPGDISKEDLPGGTIEEQEGYLAEFPDAIAVSRARRDNTWLYRLVLIVMVGSLLFLGVLVPDARPWVSVPLLIAAVSTGLGLIWRLLNRG